LIIAALVILLGLAGCAPSYEQRGYRSVGYGGVGYGAGYGGAGYGAAGYYGGGGYGARGSACGRPNHYNRGCATPYHGQQHAGGYGSGYYGGGGRGQVYGPYVAKPAFWGERRLRRTSEILVYYY
jgi:hypothetical protein